VHLEHRRQPRTPTARGRTRPRARRRSASRLFTEFHPQARGGVTPRASAGPPPRCCWSRAGARRSGRQQRPRRGHPAARLHGPLPPQTRPPARYDRPRHPAALPARTPPRRFPAGPLPRGTRYTFNADSLVLSNVQTLSDLLAHIPGVYVARRAASTAPGRSYSPGGRGGGGSRKSTGTGVAVPAARAATRCSSTPARIPLAPLERHRRDRAARLTPRLSRHAAPTLYGKPRPQVGVAHRRK